MAPAAATASDTSWRSPHAAAAASSRARAAATSAASTCDATKGGAMNALHTSRNSGRPGAGGDDSPERTPASKMRSGDTIDHNDARTRSGADAGHRVRNIEPRQG